jgi:single-stranded-DNA-specific exonuclease
MDKRWVRSPSAPPESVAAIARELDLPELFARLLAQRGFDTPAAAHQYLHSNLEDLHDPFRMKDLRRAAERLDRACALGERVFVFGDYDVDGITAAAMFTEILGNLGARVTPRIPERLREGYGLSQAAVREAAAGGARVVVTTDCGITAHAEAALARELGMDLIVTDHHEPQDGRPPALAVVNPKQADCSYPCDGLAGVGVAFKVLDGLLRLRGACGVDPRLCAMLDLVALGTIADMVPLLGENRVLARAGLEAISASRRPGIKALLQSAGLGGKAIDSGDVGFVLAPRINAAGRLGDSASGIRLLLTRDPEVAADMARALENGNQERRRLDEVVEREACDMLPDDPSLCPPEPIVLSSSGWHSGVLGIVASRIVDRFRRPAILISFDNGVGKGSGRSVGDFDLAAAVSGCRDLLEGFGGHRHAVGLTIRRERLAEFSQRLARTSRTALEGMDLRSCVTFDTEEPLRSSTLELTRCLDRMAPFGLGNPEPVFLTRGVGAVSKPRVLGKDTLRLTAYHSGFTCECVGFRMGALAARPEADWRRFSMVYTPIVNRWRGAETVELKIRDVRPEP